MRILHVFPTFAHGGVQIRIADVANRLGEGVGHMAVALDGNTQARARLAPQTTWDFVDGVPGGGLRQCRAIAGALRRLAPDLLCTYNFGAMDWALVNSWWARLPHLHFESGFGPDEAERLLPYRNAYRRLALRRAKRLVVPSHRLLDLASRHRWVDSSRMTLIPNGVDLQWYDPQVSVTPLETVDAAAPTVVSVAPLRREKRLDRLIRLFVEADAPGGARLIICGSGPCEAELRAQAANSPAHERIHFAGHVDDVRRVLRGSAILAMTSETEQMPNALLQAMAMYRPVVAFDAGDIARILPDVQRPFVHAQQDDAGFAASLGRLLGDDALREGLGGANRKRASASYDMRDMVRAYSDLYRETVESAA